MKVHFRPCLVLFALLTLLTGVAYPALITVIAQVVFHDQANGSLIMRDCRAVGSDLIGQAFDDPSYFRGRPSATGPTGYNSAASSGGSDAVRPSPRRWSACLSLISASSSPGSVSRSEMHSTC